MSLLQRLANVPLDSLPLAHPSDACFQRFGPIGYEHKDGTLPWEVLETALVEAFKCPSNPEEEELKSGPLGLELVIKAFQSLKEELEDEQHEIERDTWIVCLTRAVNAKIECVLHLSLLVVRLTSSRTPAGPRRAKVSTVETNAELRLPLLPKRSSAPCSSSKMKKRRGSARLSVRKRLGRSSP